MIVVIKCLLKLFLFYGSCSNSSQDNSFTKPCLVIINRGGPNFDMDYSTAIIKFLELVKFPSGFP